MTSRPRVDCPHCDEPVIATPGDLCPWCANDLTTAIQRSHKLAEVASYAAACSLLQTYDPKLP